MTHDETKMTHTARASLTLAAVLCGFALAIAACSSVGRDLPPPEQVYAPLTGPIDRQEYRIQAGDRLNIKFPYHKRSNQELPVRPDGKITLEVTGELVVEGLTARELEGLIKQHSAHRLRDPEVVVMVTAFGDRRVYVGGEVGRPGFIVIQEGMTPLQAVLAAGGFKDTAQRDSVLYVSRASSGDYKATRVDLDDAVKNGTPEQVRLAGNDVVFVPATRIANAAIFVRQYFRDILPVDSRMGATAALPGF